MTGESNRDGQINQEFINNGIETLNTEGLDHTQKLLLKDYLNWYKNETDFSERAQLMIDFLKNPHEFFLTTLARCAAYRIFVLARFDNRNDIDAMDIKFEDIDSNRLRNVKVEVAYVTKIGTGGAVLVLKAEARADSESQWKEYQYRGTHFDLNDWVEKKTDLSEIK